MTRKSRSSAAGGGTGRMTSVKRIAVVAAVVLLLSMAVVGAASADGSVLTVEPTSAQYSTTSTEMSLTATFANPLPSDYTAVEYIQSTGHNGSYSAGPYIDTGIAPEDYQNIKLVLDVEYEGGCGNLNFSGFGTWEQGSSYGYWFKIDIKSSTSVGVQCGGPSTEVIVSGVSIKDRNMMSLDTITGRGYIGTKGYAINKIDEQSKNITNNFNLFRVNGINNSYAKAKCYGFEIYSNNVLVAKFVPCVYHYGSDDAVVGMYDIVRNEFFVNAGSGAFTAGDPIIYSSFNSYDWYVRNETGTSDWVKFATATTTDRCTYTPANFANNLLFYVTASNGTYSISSETVLFTVYTDITLDQNGGDGGTTGLRLTQNRSNTTSITNPTKTEYTFNGWYTSDSGGYKIIDTSGTLVNNVSGYTDANGNWTYTSGTLTLYAKWIGHVSYDGNGETSGTAPVDSGNPHNAGTSVTVLDNTGNLSKTGYYFDGWNTKTDGTGDDYAEGSSLTMPADNVTLYAKWVENPVAYTVVIPPKVSLVEYSTIGVPVEYSIEKTSGNAGTITMTLSDSTYYYNGTSNGFKIKDTTKGTYLGYSIFQDGTQGSEITGLNTSFLTLDVGGTQESSSQKLWYKLNDTVTYAGTYEDLLTFTVSVSDT